MFDFFKEMTLELFGTDSDSVREIEKEKAEEKRKSRFIFSKTTKVVVYVLGVLYLAIGGFGIYVSLQVAKLTQDATAGSNIWRYVKYGFLSLIDIAAMSCLFSGKKKGEIVALVLILVFVVTMYFTTMILPVM